MKKKREHPHWIKKLKNRYRLLLINESNFQEKATIKITPFSVLALFVVGFFSFFLISWLIIFAVPALRIYMPGHEPDQSRKVKQELVSDIYSIESSIKKLEERKVMFDLLLRGDELSETDIAILQDQIDADKEYREREKLASNPYDSSRGGDRYSEQFDNYYTFDERANEMSNVPATFFSPLSGKITNYYVPNKHPAIDIVPSKDETIKAALDGIIIFTGWTPNYGNVICIQHADNWMTIYKHCAQVYGKTGSRVNAGEVIGVVGNTGELSSGPHLHFELWHNGVSLNPFNFIRFE